MKTIYPVPVLLLPLLVFVASCSTEPPVVVEVPLEQEPIPEVVAKGEPEVESAIPGEGRIAESTIGSTGNDSVSGEGSVSETSFTDSVSWQTTPSDELIQRNETPAPTIATELEPLVPLLPQRSFSREPSLSGTIFQPEARPASRDTAAFHQNRSVHANASVTHKRTPDVHGLALRSKKPSVHRIHPSQSFTIEGKEGTLVNIPAGSLAFETGEPCNLPATVRMWEFYTLPDILLAGLSTDCDEGLLQTGGMIYLEAEAKGLPLKVSKGRKIKVDFNPVRTIDSEFDLFHGVKENKRISWRRVKAAKPKEQKPNTEKSIARVTIHDASQGENSSVSRSKAMFVESIFSFVFDDEGDAVSEYVNDFSKPRTFVGLGTASFANGTKIFFDGALQVSSFQYHGTKNYQRYGTKEAEASPSRMVIDFQGGFLAAKIPPQHQDSSFSLVLRENTRINPIIRSTPSSSGCFFILNERLSPIGSLLPEYKKVRYDNWEERIGDNHTLRCLQGKVGVYSSKHYLNLDAQMGRDFGILSPAEKTSVGNLHGNGPFEGNFAKRIVESTSSKIEKAIKDTETAKRQSLQIPQATLRGFLRPRQNALALNRIRTQANDRRILLQNCLKELQGSEELCEVLVSAAKRIDEPETMSRCSDLQGRLKGSIQEFAAWTGQKDLAAMDAMTAKVAAVSKFSSEFLSARLSSEFLSARLSWHNLDKLSAPRNGMESYDLASDFSFDPITQEDAEETKVDTSFGPYFFAVWPQAGISSNAFVGMNRVPRGNFKAIGFAVDTNGEIFADFKNARTGGKIKLDLKAMDRELFRRTVSGWPGWK